MPIKSAIDPRILHSKIFPTKKRTYIDYAIDDKRHVPNKFYDTGRSLLDDRGKSDMEKGKRQTIMDQVLARQRINPTPAPNAYKANMKAIEKKNEPCVKFQSPQRAMLDEPMYVGYNSPQYYSSQYNQVDKKVSIPLYRKKIKEDYDVATFLKTSLPTKKVSPASYNVIESYKTTSKSPKQFMFRGRTATEFEMLAKRAKKVPGVGQYPIASIDKGLSLTTKGASRGWK